MNIKFKIEDTENESGGIDRQWSRIRLLIDGKPYLAEEPVWHLDATSRVPAFAGECARAIRINAKEFPGVGGWTSKLPNIERLLEKLDGIEMNYYKPEIEYQRSR